MLNAPIVFTLMFVWPQDCLREDIADIYSLLPSSLSIQEFLRTESAKVPSYQLRGCVCYYGRHYVAFFNTAGRDGWLMFDDRRVSRVGDWKQLCDRAITGKLQPILAFYEKPEPQKKLQDTKQLAETMESEWIKKEHQETHSANNPNTITTTTNRFISPGEQSNQARQQQQMVKGSLQQVATAYSEVETKQEAPREKLISSTKGSQTMEEIQMQNDVIRGTAAISSNRPQTRFHTAPRPRPQPSQQDDQPSSSPLAVPVPIPQILPQLKQVRQASDLLTPSTANTPPRPPSIPKHRPSLSDLQLLDSDNLHMSVSRSNPTSPSHSLDVISKSRSPSPSLVSSAANSAPDPSSVESDVFFGLDDYTHSLQQQTASTKRR